MAGKIEKVAVPDNCLMTVYRDMPGCEADNFQATFPGPVTLDAYIAAFFDTPLFRLERLILRLFAGRATTRADVVALANGQANSFAMWHVVERSDTEIMLAVERSRIRSWLAIVPPEKPGDPTILRFGSAIVPKSVSASGKGQIGFLFRALTGFHNLYSRLLLRAAISALSKQ